MKLAVELSLYPLTDNYLEVIQYLVERLKQYPQIERHTNGMSTQLQGDHQAVMALLATELAACHQRFGKNVLVCKFITGGVNLNHSE
ncbi:YkoF family thiamine/hydroxymethylpyrimidine-binding protein [Ferrimonas senticii]|uniref:YkoF family thiamine/hydroxymethylpyrimidine-binding protein n=1 Tax=Ferrimonas senticii TaxID=394566 RepID=UPI000427B9F4|nr:YkoF family thiamine/hydroxymethylpyrimidine-binding protein [Ferrimonas senticii]